LGKGTENGHFSFLVAPDDRRQMSGKGCRLTIAAAGQGLEGTGTDSLTVQTAG